MIRFKNNVFDDYFIDEHKAVITDANGNVVPQRQYGNYMTVKINYLVMHVHCIQAHTKWGYKGRKFQVHHEDENTLNNDIDNLKYMLQKDHVSLTHKGRKKSAQARANMSKARKGKKMPPMSEEQKKKISIALTGKPKSEEAKENMSKAQKGRKRGPMSEEHKKQIAEAVRQSMTEEKRKQIAEAVKKSWEMRRNACL